jgi:hypothetical protein
MFKLSVIELPVTAFLLCALFFSSVLTVAVLAQAISKENPHHDGFVHFFIRL